MRNSKEPMLLLDCGGFFAKYSDNDIKAKANISIKSMNLMGYDAINLSGREFLFGTDYLNKLSSGSSFSFISSNIEQDKTHNFNKKKYIIKNIAGIKVAVIGILPNNAFEYTENSKYTNNVKIITPETALQKILSEIVDKSDMIVLLSQLESEDTQALLQRFKSINIAIICGVEDSCEHDKKNTTDSHQIVNAGSEGKSLGIISVSMAASGKISIGPNKIVKLNDSVLGDNRISKLINKLLYDEVVEARKLRAKKKREVLEKIHQETMKGLNLSPLEFIRKNNQEKKENKGENNL